MSLRIGQELRLELECPLRHRNDPESSTMKNLKTSCNAQRLVPTFLKGIYISASFVLVSFAASPAVPCELDGYDKAIPESIGDTTPKTERTRFAWSTDVDPWQGNARSWHYIRNLHERNLSAKWEKVGLTIRFDNPRTTGKVACAIGYGNEQDFRLDKSAPIITTNDGTKPAVAYVVDPSNISRTDPVVAGAEIITNYETDESNTSAASAKLVLYFYPSTNHLEVHVSTGNNGETMAFRPQSIGVEVDLFASELTIGDDENVERTSLETLVGGDEFTLGALSDISSDNFIRFSLFPLRVLRFTITDASRDKIEDTALVLVSPQGRLIAAKKVFSSLFAN